MERYYYEYDDEDDAWWIYDRLNGDQPMGCMDTRSSAQTIVGLLNSANGNTAP